MLRRELTLRLTAACVVLAAALSQLTLARAEPQGGPAGAASDKTVKAATTEAELGRASCRERVCLLV